MALFQSTLATDKNMGSTAYLELGTRSSQRLKLLHNIGVVAEETMPIYINETPIVPKLIGDIDCSRNPPFPEAVKGDTFRVTKNGSFGTVLVTANTLVTCVADFSPESRDPIVSMNWITNNNSAAAGTTTVDPGEIQDYKITDVPDLENPSDHVILTEKAMAESIQSFIVAGNLSAINCDLEDGFTLKNHMRDGIMVVRATLVIFGDADPDLYVSILNTKNGETLIWQHLEGNNTYSLDVGVSSEYLSIGMRGVGQTNGKLILEYLGAKTTDNTYYDPEHAGIDEMDNAYIDELMRETSHRKTDF